MSENVELPYEFNLETNHMQSPTKINKKYYVYDRFGNIIEKQKLGAGGQILLFIAVFVSPFPIMWALIPSIFTGICAGYRRGDIALNVGIFYTLSVFLGSIMIVQGGRGGDVSSAFFGLVLFVITLFSMHKVFDTLPRERVDFSWIKFIIWFMIVFIVLVIIFFMMIMSNVLQS
ncbi:hypothetical protein [Campylobacter corcagiensis]|uniref:Uncharacterized protein n=1 Tax=Campylobacter corcagiensis TaxID=1448857 RepID=A0A7M1LDU1_9BACT|nr:hypothetical protein [Campylobacter corcagiensis]QKF65117.1 putative membrane protein [Campylobacter corcagiensis]QOQ86739.1 hypothetical protein IMC76_05820 [Campylobacter corcagiensis]